MHSEIIGQILLKNAQFKIVNGQIVLCSQIKIVQFLKFIIMDSKHEKIIGLILDKFFVYIRNF